MNRKISLMIVVIILLQIILPILTVIVESDFTIMAVAADVYETTVNGITWQYQLKDNNAVSVRPKDKSQMIGEITIPSTLDGHDVISIGYSSFYNCGSLTNIEIPESVTKIESGVFRNCTSLTRINIPTGVTSIGDHAFSGCSSLTNIEIPGSVTKIESGVFLNCASLKSINIPEGITNIENYTFSGCSSLINIEIPTGVKRIGEYTFYNCNNLTRIDVNGNNNYFSSEDGVLFNKEKSILICYPAKRDAITYIIPNSVTSIENFAFFNCSNLTSINIPESVTKIESGVFLNCSNLTSINIPEGVTSIGSHAFHGCSSLTSIEISESVTNIGESAFRDCTSLSRINIPTGVTSIEDSVFHDCKSLTNIKIPLGITRIGVYSFYGSGLTYVEIPEGVTSIEHHAFANSRNLQRIILPDSITSIGDYAFSGIHTSQITIPKSLTNIGEKVFNCFFTRVAIQTGELNEGEITVELPTILKRTLDEEDIMYANGKEPTLSNCTISYDNETITFNVDDMKKSKVRVRIEDGPLYNLTVVVVVPSGTILYGNTSVTTNPVTATIYIEEEEEVINNEGKTTYIFEENGEFTFIYRDKEGIEHETTAKVDWILKKGDANGDDKIDFNDILAINKHRLGKVELTGNNLIAADVTGDGVADFSDILQINKFRLGKISKL